MISQENPKNFSSPRTSRRKRRGAVFFSATAFAAASLTGFAADAAVDDTPVMAFDTDLATACSDARTLPTTFGRTVVTGVPITLLGISITLYQGTAADEIFLLASSPGSPNVVLAGDGDDIVCGSDGEDEVHGGGGQDLIFGAAGADDLYGDGGADHIDGGAGDDKVHLGPAGKDVGGIFGGDGADLLEGGDGSDKLDGGFGADMLVGGADGDDLDGGDDTDVLFGGLGSDTYEGGTVDTCVDVDEDAVAAAGSSTCGVFAPTI